VKDATFLNLLEHKLAKQCSKNGHGSRNPTLTVISNIFI
jgi:hypothetical protein